MPTMQDVERAREQAYLDTLYTRLDEVREITRGQLRGVLLNVGTGTPQSIVERDVFAAAHADRLARLDAAEGRLCFGAMDHDDGRRTYIGRIGLSDSEQEPILVDWRAPVATAFYRATLADPQGLVRRRHLRTRGREVTGIADDPLGPIGPAPGGTVAQSGDSMLLETLAAPRTGRMHDIIATLQAEQDRIIRARANGILVVDGGPGTGKTAVALHRAAYLLYNDRARLDQSGVLIVGPSPVFLRYIDQVLPSLGETGVVFATPGRLFPGVDATGTEPVEVATLKGDPRMAEVVAGAIRDRQRLPHQELVINYGDHVLRLDQDTVARARTRARRSRRPHNSARRVFLRELLAELTTQVVRQIPGGLLDADERGQITRDLWAEEEIRAVLDGLWPLLTPQQLIGDLFADSDALARAAGSRLRPAERALLLDLPPARPGRSLPGRSLPGAGGPRASQAGGVGGPEAVDDADDLFAAGNLLPTVAGAGSVDPRAASRIPVPRTGDPTVTADRPTTSRAAAGGERRWTPADVPLLDEAAELLGDPEEEAGLEAARRADRERAEEREYARGVVDMLGLEGQIDAAALADRWSGPRVRRSAAEHAREDRSWAFGHLIVDEAQEVSPMLWRLLWRRCPGRTATLVGDLAQTARPGAPTSWAELLAPVVDERFTVERLSVNYRTPQEIMDVAAEVLRAQNPSLTAPVSVRAVGRRPTALRVGDVAVEDVPGLARLLGDAPSPAGQPSAQLLAAVAHAARREAAGGPGRVAVITRPRDVLALRSALMALLPDLAVVADSVDPASAAGNALDAPVAVLSVAETKGLEFDAVVLVEPAALLTEPTRGLADLYVALTRATRSLSVVHSGELPPVLSGLEQDCPDRR
ncbi:HelD family protein [Candidatus Frankia alpina]|uniref:Helicase n=1 Tax=Candidatus Frankia alpina TaxID=2699483 RepID=A0A4S5EQK5_9ACTN|nr:ATP-binding domain-containing protein [Candidatus Frankia alpina]THJ74576.1 helicase [Candidatus Frankia alpina]